MFNSMLRKVSVPMTIGVVLTLLKMFFPNVEQPEGLQDSIIMVVNYIWGFFTVGAMTYAGYKVKESRAKLDRLDTVP